MSIRIATIVTAALLLLLLNARTIDKAIEDSDGVLQHAHRVTQQP
jgi:hypothetical protein